MFWKALVVTLGGFVVEAYRRWRNSRPLVLRQNKSGTYVVDDRLARFERGVKLALNIGFYLLLMWWTVLAYLLFIG